MANLPKLPNIGDFQVGTDRVLLYLEPLVPKTKIPKNLDLLNRKQKEEFMKNMELEMSSRRLEVGTIRRGIVLSVPVDIDKSKFKFEVGSIVYVPNETNVYEVINLDRTPLYFVGPRDIRGTVNTALTDEEIAKWEDDQDTYIRTVVYPELDSPEPVMPAPRGTKGISEGGIITDLSNNN